MRQQLGPQFNAHDFRLVGHLLELAAGAFFHFLKGFLSRTPSLAHVVHVLSKGFGVVTGDAENGLHALDTAQQRRHLRYGAARGIGHNPGSPRESQLADRQFAGLEPLPPEDLREVIAGLG